ncbi:prolipoprotein diacylglyceryl transferase [Clostridia bacterium]|nr:prolipoprotein diacylglyceryl transferase [Clostridia bacterium]
MNPIAFKLGPISVHWYGILIGIGIALALLVVFNLSKKTNLDTDEVIDACIYMLPFGFVGARLYYVIFNLGYYMNRPDEIIKVWHGGLAIHGGVIAALIFLYFYSKRKKMDLLHLLDTLAPAVILAQAIGRWGNFINQEAYGGIVSKAYISHFPNFIQEGMLIGGNYHHPTFLYESVWNLGVFAILLYLSLRQTKPKGSILAGYLMLYSMGRFFIEGLRTDSLMFGPLRVAQVVSLLGVIVGLVILYVAKRRDKVS